MKVMYKGFLIRKLSYFLYGCIFGLYITLLIGVVSYKSYKNDYSKKTKVFYADYEEYIETEIEITRR